MKKPVRFVVVGAVGGLVVVDGARVVVAIVVVGATVVDDVVVVVEEATVDVDDAIVEVEGAIVDVAEDVFVDAAVVDVTDDTGDFVVDDIIPVDDGDIVVDDAITDVIEDTFVDIIADVEPVPPVGFCIVVVNNDEPVVERIAEFPIKGRDGVVVDVIEFVAVPNVVDGNVDPMDEFGIPVLIYGVKFGGTVE